MIKRIILTLGLAIGLIAAMPTPARAFNPFGGVDCTNSQNQKSAICQSGSPTGDPVAGSDGILAKVTNIVAFVAGVGAIILIIVGSIRYITSGGDADDVKRAKSSITHALIGLAVVVLARTLILFVLSKFKS